VFHQNGLEYLWLEVHGIGRLIRIVQERMGEARQGAIVRAPIAEGEQPLVVVYMSLVPMLDRRSQLNGLASSNWRVEIAIFISSGAALASSVNCLRMQVISPMRVRENLAAVVHAVLISIAGKAAVTANSPW
jgi:hypothetical protein